MWGSTENSNKLEKLPVVVGDYDENLGKYEILEGLSEEDYIAFPSGAMEEGLPVLVTDDLQLMMESSLQMDIDQEGDALPIDSEDEDTENQESLSDEEVNPLDGTEIIDQEGEQGINNMDAGSDIDIPDDISQNVQVIDEWSDEMPMEDAASESGMTMDEDLTPVNELSDEDMQMMDEAFPVEGEEMG